jgi:hypothetical protein
MVLGLWEGDLARGAQQQAGQREERGRKETDELGLMHDEDYNGIHG